MYLGHRIWEGGSRVFILFFGIFEILTTTKGLQHHRNGLKRSHGASVAPSLSTIPSKI